MRSYACLCLLSPFLSPPQFFFFPLPFSKSGVKMMGKTTPSFLPPFSSSSSLPFSPSSFLFSSPLWETGKLADGSLCDRFRNCALPPSLFPHFFFFPPSQINRAVRTYSPSSLSRRDDRDRRLSRKASKWRAFALLFSLFSLFLAAPGNK